MFEYFILIGVASRVAAAARGGVFEGMGHARASGWLPDAERRSRGTRSIAAAEATLLW